MRRLRLRGILTIAAIALAAGLLATQPGRAEGQSAGGNEWSKTFAVSGKPELRVETNDANVHLESWDQNAIEAEVTMRGFRLALHSGEGGVRVDDRQLGDRVEIEVHVPSVHWSVGIDSRSVRIELKVPRQGRYEIRTGDGHIEARDVRGDLRLSSGDGHIEGEQLDGTLHAKSGDGRMRIRGRFDELALETGDGSIEARCEPGSKIAAVWTLQSGDGHVTLSLPSDFAADLEARTRDGHVKVDFPVTTSGNLSGSEVHGKMNGGGAQLRVHTGDGSIHIERL